MKNKLEMKLVFATNNKNKVEEIKALLPDSLEILSLADIGCHEDIEETEKTLEGNARLKANYIAKNYDYNCFADDTGLEVEALNGAPGVYSARYAGPQASYADNVNKLLVELNNHRDRKAEFKTVIALYLNGKQYVFEGICKGQILKEKRGQKGFGYDPVFQPENFNQTFAEMTLEEKSKISHRAIATKKLIDFLNKL